MQVPEPHKSRHKAIDAIVTHPFWGFPIFFFILFLIFEGTFALGRFPMDGIEWLLLHLEDWLAIHLEEGPLKDLLVNGIVRGVGSVVVFLPNIVILYLFISLIEETGYITRAAYIMDKFMRKVGLHGEAFIPLVMGFGCNVPAILSTHIIKDRTTRLITILISPLMSCSARLPVYILLVTAFFPKNGGLVLFCIYLFGIALALLLAKLFRRLLKKPEDHPFAAEFQPYKMPTWGFMARQAWERTSQYLKKMGGFILVASIIIWFLGYYPHETGFCGEKSYIARIGHWLEPVMYPLGFDWQMTTSLLSGMAAKELIVSTLGILYPHGAFPFTPLSALSFMLFVLIYFPCIASIAAIHHALHPHHLEHPAHWPHRHKQPHRHLRSGHWEWVAVLYTTGLAWLISFVVYQVGLLFHWGV